MKTIRTLVKDVYNLFGSGHKATPDNVEELAKAMAAHVENAMAKHEPKGKLRGSIMGTKCQRKLWFDVNQPDKAEPLEPWVKLKFLYGNLLEEIVLFLAKEAGHEVTKRQHEVDIKGIKGHIDGVVDGVLSDVKSASGYGMTKFKEHNLENDDPFGYLTQIDFYKEGLKEDPDVTVKGEVAFIAVDKSNGMLCVDTYRRDEANAKTLLDKVDQSIEVVASDTIPPRGYDDVAEGASGNRKLCTECSYCPYKHTCWPGLIGYIYSRGPVWLTKVVKEPNVARIQPTNTPRSPDS